MNTGQQSVNNPAGVCFVAFHHNVQKNTVRDAGVEWKVLTPYVHCEHVTTVARRQRLVGRRDGYQCGFCSECRLDAHGR